MAFYGSKGDSDNCYWTPSQYYDSGESQLFHYNSSACYKDDSFENPSELEPKMLQHEPPEHHSCYNNYYELSLHQQNYYEHSVIPPEINYSEPKLIQYEPTPCYGDYYYPETKFTISYSKAADFYEDEFEEYDPTPYGGGYDQTIAYGKPLLPSDDICYPRSMPQSNNTSLENFSYSSIPSPYGKDDDLPKKPPNESKPIDTKTETKTETPVDNVDKASSDGSDDEVLEPSDVIPSDDSSSSDENQKGVENGTSRGDYGYETERQVGQIPYGSGLETLDLCESIFGYWPCLAKIEQERRSKCCHQETRMDPWKGAADYLFGSPGVYDYENYHHHQQQQQAQYDFYEDSWLQ